MFKKKPEDEVDPPASPPKKEEVEHAYEDAWYRALKAQSARPVESEDASEAVED